MITKDLLRKRIPRLETPTEVELFDLLEVVIDERDEALKKDKSMENDMILIAKTLDKVDRTIGSMILKDPGGTEITIREFCGIKEAYRILSRENS